MAFKIETFPLPDTDRETRRSPEMEKYIRIMPTAVRGEPNAHVLFLEIGNQRFDIGRTYYDTKDEAIWMGDMLAIALAKVKAE